MYVNWWVNDVLELSFPRPRHWQDSTVWFYGSDRILDIRAINSFLYTPTRHKRSRARAQPHTHTHTHTLSLSFCVCERAQINESEPVWRHITENMSSIYGYVKIIQTYQGLIKLSKWLTPLSISSYIPLLHSPDKIHQWLLWGGGCHSDYYFVLLRNGNCAEIWPVTCDLFTHAARPAERRGLGAFCRGQQRTGRQKRKFPGVQHSHQFGDLSAGSNLTKPCAHINSGG